MKVHHLNCSTWRTVAASENLICHCLLIDIEDRLVLVDTGLGEKTLNDPKRFLTREFRKVNRPALDPKETAFKQIKTLGYRTEDVSDIIVTHLDEDHVGGIADFPAANIHVFNNEYEAAVKPASFSERARYNAGKMWAHGPRWIRYEVQGERWFDFDAVRELSGLPPEILLVPLPGHTRGHCGVAVQYRSGYLLHAGDAYAHRHEIDPFRPGLNLEMQIYQFIGHVDKELKSHNVERLRELVLTQCGEIEIFCSHDPKEFSHFQHM